MNLVFNGSLPDAQIWARRALEHCSAAAKIETNPDAWRLATEGEANLLIGNFPEALQLYRDAIATQPDPWRLESMYMQALETARQLKNKQVAADLAQTFPATTVLLVGGATHLPFDVALLRAVQYQIDGSGKPADPASSGQTLSGLLTKAREQTILKVTISCPLLVSKIVS